MGNDYEFRKYRQGDETGIFALLRSAFPKWSRRSVDFWKWKYLDSPLGRYVYLALDGDKIIGVVCDLPLRIKIGDEVTLGIYSDDTAMDANYRGRGIYSRLDKFGRESKDNVEYFSYWETENPIVTKVASQYSDMLFPFQLCRMIKIKDVEIYLEKIGKDTFTNKLGFTILKGSNSLANIVSSKGKTKQDYSINDAKKFGEGVDVFWDQVKDDYNYIIEKKRDYLNWRYCSFGAEDYVIRLATKGEEVLGYSVLRYRGYEDSSEGSIMDLLALRNRPDVVQGLMDDALERFEKLGVNSVYCQTIRDHPYQKFFAKRGFVDVSMASKNLVYYNFRNKPGFDHKTLAKYSPKSIYFNLY